MFKNSVLIFSVAVVLSATSDVALGLPFTHNYFHPELSKPSANPLHKICRWV